MPRSIDGSCNHHTHPLWGASLTPLRRVLPPQYENGFNSAVGEDPDTLYHGHRQGRGCVAFVSPFLKSLTFGN